MKYFTLILVFALLGCGDLKKEIRRLQDNRDHQQRQIDELKKQLNINLINTIAQIDTLQSLIDGLQDQIDTMSGDVSLIETSINLVETNINTLQSTSNNTLSQLIILQGYTQIVSFIDPCGDGPGYDEIILQTTQGYVAYFESGSNRFLSVLPNGNYQTTDQQACNFSIVNGVFQ